MSYRTIFTMLFTVALMYAIFRFGAPFLLALIIAILLDPIIHVCMRYNRISRRTAALSVCTLFTLILLFLGYSLGAKIVDETTKLIKMISEQAKGTDLVADLTARVEAIVESVSPNLADQVETGLGSALRSLTGLITGVSTYLINLAGAIPNFFLSFVVFLIALYLLAMNLPKVKESFLSQFEETTALQVEAVLKTLRKAINGFIFTALVMSMITFVIVLGGFIILKTDYALALAFFVTVVDILPVLGTGTVLIPWAVYELITGDTFTGIGLVVIYLVTLVVRRVLEPKILGDAVGIGSLSALISLYVGFTVLGVAGLFLGPLVVIVYTSMRSVGLLNFKIKLE